MIEEPREKQGKFSSSEKCNDSLTFATEILGARTPGLAAGLGLLAPNLPVPALTLSASPLGEHFLPLKNYSFNSF